MLIHSLSRRIVPVNPCDGPTRTRMGGRAEGGERRVARRGCENRSAKIQKSLRMRSDRGCILLMSGTTDDDTTHEPLPKNVHTFPPIPLSPVGLPPTGTFLFAPGALPHEMLIVRLLRVYAAFMPVRFNEGAAGNTPRGVPAAPKTHIASNSSSLAAPAGSPDLTGHFSARCISIRARAIRASHAVRGWRRRGGARPRRCARSGRRSS